MCEIRGEVMNRWISVKDKMPAIGQPIILFANGVVQKETHTLDAGDVSDYHVEYFWVNNHVDCSEESYEIKDNQMWQALPEKPST